MHKLIFLSLILLTYFSRAQTIQDSLIQKSVEDSLTKIALIEYCNEINQKIVSGKNHTEKKAYDDSLSNGKIEGHYIKGKLAGIFMRSYSVTTKNILFYFNEEKLIFASISETEPDVRNSMPNGRYCVIYFQNGVSIKPYDYKANGYNSETKIEKRSLINPYVPLNEIPVINMLTIENDLIKVCEKYKRLLDQSKTK